MNIALKGAIAALALAAAGHAAAQITFYTDEDFHGRNFRSNQAVNNLEDFDFNDRASSIAISSRRWQICENARFEGRCVVLGAGNYPSLAAMGLNDRVSSARLFTTRTADGGLRREGDSGMVPVYDGRRRPSERLDEARVTSVRAVMGAPEQRCWVEPEAVTSDRGNANVPGAIAGAVLGGILGHQIGGGMGRDLATAGGAVAGAAIGANVGRDGPSGGQGVQRCATSREPAAPAYWDVSYTYRGREHQVQRLTRPGPTVTVNTYGEPRD